MQNPNQLIFDAAVKHIFKQGEPARDKHGHLVIYGGDTGLSVFGMLVPNVIQFKGTRANREKAMFHKDKLPLMMQRYIDIIQALDMISRRFDAYDADEYMKIPLAAIAKKHWCSDKILTQHSFNKETKQIEYAEQEPEIA